MIIINNYELLFLKNEQESKKWTLKKVNRKEKLSQINSLNYQLINLINEYTNNHTYNENKEINLKKNHKNIEIISDEDSLIIKTPSCDINVIKLNDKIINTSKRRGTCHQNSIILSLNINKNNNLVTGYVSGLRKSDKYLHSVVEVEINKKKYILDYTLNALINKEGYDYLMNFKEISRISKSNLKKDYIVYDKFQSLDLISTKQYLVYRDEILSDLSRNKQIFIKGMKK